MATIRWTSMAEVQTRPLEWLWDGWIPLAKVTLLDGEPGAGKSLLALDLAARVSRGASMPLSHDKPRGPAHVALFNEDDTLTDTIRPRLEAAGADLSNIHGFDAELSLSDLTDLKPTLIVIDPLSVYLNLEDRRTTRHALRSLSLLARESGAAILVVQYLPKGGSWVGEVFDAARSVMHVAAMGHSRHRLSVIKSNLRAVSEVTPLVYHFEPTVNAVRITGWADSV